MSTRAWQVEVDDRRHTVELHHGTITGRRRVFVDGEEVALDERGSVIDFGGQSRFAIGDATAAVHITTNGFTFRYDLSVEGRFVESGERVAERTTRESSTGARNGAESSDALVSISRIVSYAGLLVAWAGIWIATDTAAALIIIGGTVLLYGGSLLIGLRRRRRSPGAVATPEQARGAHDTLRAVYLSIRVAVPILCVLIFIYVDSTLGRALVVGGLLVSAFAGIPAERATLARLREQAQETGSGIDHGKNPPRAE